jgi:predicted nucleic acid-binding protein
MGAKKIILCDTGVVFDYFRSKPAMLSELDGLGFSRLAISVITTAEVLAGMHKHEARRTRDLLGQFSYYDFDKEISQCFIDLMSSQYERRPGLPDMMIAATALVCQVELFTLNRADFDFLPGIRLYNPRYQHNQPKL